MAELIDSSGKPVYVPEHKVAAAIASGNFTAAPGQEVTISHERTGAPITVQAEDVAGQIAAGAGVESGQAMRARERMTRLERAHGGIVERGLRGVESAAGAATGGLTTAIIGEIGGEEYREGRAEFREAFPLQSTITDVVGLAVPGLGTLGAARLGAKGVRALAAEGAIVGALETSHQQALSEKPFNAEQFASNLGSNMLYGGAGGLAVGVFAKAASKGLKKAKTIADDMATRATRKAGISDDLAKMSRTELKAAEVAEVAVTKKAAGTANTAIADDILELHKISKVAKIEKKLDKALTRHVGNMKALSKNPAKALDTLERTEQSLVGIAKAGGDADKLAAVEGLIQKNRSLQVRIADAVQPPVTPRMQQIQDAIEFATPAAGAGKGFIQRTAETMVTGAGAGALSPIMGFTAGAVVASKASDALSGLVFGRMAKAGAETSKRTAAALEKLMDVGAKTAQKAPPLATRILAGTSFAPAVSRAPLPKATLVNSFKARAQEIQSQVTMGPNGPTMRPEARMKVAERLAGVRAVSPSLADQIETVANRKMGFLASKLPKRPDFLADTMGPDSWQPSNMAMRTFAQYVAGVEDPGSVEEHLADGTLSPEMAEAYRTVYPERYAAMQRQIIENIHTLRATLPYPKRLSLSIFSGVSVDPALDPRIFRQYQAQFTDEPGAEGGTAAPVAQAQFGSVKVPEPTKAQERAG